MRHVATALFSLAAAASAAQTASPEPYAFSLSESHRVLDAFLGFGAEWDTCAYDQYGTTDEDFAVVLDRIRFMRTPIVRMMMQAKWCYRGPGQFDFESRDMQLLYRQLDFCQKENIAVLLTDWGCEPEWLRVPDFENVADPEYAAAIGQYMEHLLVQRGYSCIKYFILVNEPNYEVRDFARWKQGLLNVAAEFAKRGLDKQVAFAGSDESNDTGWHEAAVREVAGTLGAYDVHCYANDVDVRPGNLEAFFRRHWQFALDNDPDAARKPFIVGEAGMNDGARHPGANANINSHYYGLFMADYAVQAARAGSAAVCAWHMDDNGHTEFEWGLWDNTKNGLRLRPWFYTWSLLSRYVPRGARIYAPPQPSQDWRILVAHMPDQGPNGWTVCLVNRGKDDVSIAITLPGEGEARLQRFMYIDAIGPMDTKGMPVPASTETVDLSAAIPVTCRAESVTLATTLPW